MRRSRKSKKKKKKARKVLTIYIQQRGHTRTWYTSIFFSWGIESHDSPYQFSQSKNTDRARKGWLWNKGWRANIRRTIRAR